MESQESKARSRREFLTLSATAAVAGVTTAVAGSPSAGADDRPVSTRGHYRETPHIRTYYELARF